MHQYHPQGFTLDLPKPSDSPVGSTIGTTLNLALETLTNIANVIKNPDLASRQDFDEAKARCAAIADAPINTDAAVTAVYNSARAVILYGEYIIAKVVGVNSSERSTGVNAHAAYGAHGIPRAVTIMLTPKPYRKSVTLAPPTSSRPRQPCPRAADFAAAAAVVRANTHVKTIANKICARRGRCAAADPANAFARAAAATARIDALDVYNTNTFAASHKIK